MDAADYEINGYRIYQFEEAKEQWSFAELNKENVNKIEVYHNLEHYPHNEWMKTFSKKAEIKELIAILQASEEKTNFAQSNEISLMYDFVFYNDRSIANYFTVFFDGESWYWYPWEEEILSNDIENYIK